MTLFLLQYLCEPITKAPLKLLGAHYDEYGNIITGELVTVTGKRYPMAK